eukprot:gene8678-8859_t
MVLSYFLDWVEGGVREGGGTPPGTTIDVSDSCSRAGRSAGGDSNRGSKSRFAPSSTDGATAQPQPQQPSAHVPSEDELLEQVTLLANQMKDKKQSDLGKAACRKRFLTNRIAQLEAFLQKASEERSRLAIRARTAEGQLRQQARDGVKQLTAHLQMKKQLGAAVATGDASDQARRAAEERCCELEAQLVAARGPEGSQAEGQLAGMADLTQKLAAAKQELASAAFQMRQQQEQLQQTNVNLTTTQTALAQEQQAFAAWKSKWFAGQQLKKLHSTGCHVWVHLFCFDWVMWVLGGALGGHWDGDGCSGNAVGGVGGGESQQQEELGCWGLVAAAGEVG